MQEQPYFTAIPDAPMVHPSVFSQNPLIASMAQDANWTMSDMEKRPINARTFIDTGILENYTYDSIDPLVTLPELDSDPNLQAVNRAYRLKARQNRIIAVDVEPEAPLDMKLESLNMPAHFTELSMNGGVHLVIQVPEDCINDENRYMFDDLSVVKEVIPNDPATNKPYQRPAFYEVILNDHFVTFTKRMIVDKPCVDYNADPAAKEQLQRFLANLVSMDKERKKERELAKKFRIEMAEGKHLDPEKKQAIDRFIGLRFFDVAKQQAHEKQLSDFGEDSSRYEMAVANGIAYHTVKNINLAEDTISFRDLALSLSETEIIHAIYLLLRDVVPYREKHDEDREGLPWLLFTSKRAYEYVKAQNAKRQKEKRTR